MYPEQGIIFRGFYFISLFAPLVGVRWYSGAILVGHDERYYSENRRANGERLKLLSSIFSQAFPNREWCWLPPGALVSRLVRGLEVGGAHAHSGLFFSNASPKKAEAPLQWQTAHTGTGLPADVSASPVLTPESPGCTLWSCPVPGSQNLDRVHPGKTTRKLLSSPLLPSLLSDSVHFPK